MIWLEVVGLVVAYLFIGFLVVAGYMYYHRNASYNDRVFGTEWSDISPCAGTLTWPFWAIIAIGFFATMLFSKIPNPNICEWYTTFMVNLFRKGSKNVSED